MLHVNILTAGIFATGSAKCSAQPIQTRILRRKSSEIGSVIASACYGVYHKPKLTVS